MKKIESWRQRSRRHGVLLSTLFIHCSDFQWRWSEERLLHIVPQCSWTHGQQISVRFGQINAQKRSNHPSFLHRVSHRYDNGKTAKNLLCTRSLAENGFCSCVNGTWNFTCRAVHIIAKVQTTGGETITYEYKKPLPEDIEPERCRQKASWPQNVFYVELHSNFYTFEN